MRVVKEPYDFFYQAVLLQEKLSMRHVGASYIRQTPKSLLCELERAVFLQDPQCGIIEAMLDNHVCLLVDALSCKAR